MPLGHVGRLGGHPATVLSWMAGHGLLPEVQRDGGLGGVQFQSLPDVLVLVIGDVVVDVDPPRLDVGVLVRMQRQGPQGRVIQGVVGLAAVARQLLEGLVVWLSSSERRV